MYLLNIQQLLVIGFNLGYVVIKQLGDRQREQTICVSNHQLMGLFATYDQAGFVVVTDDGVIHMYRLFEPQSQAADAKLVAVKPITALENEQRNQFMEVTSAQVKKLSSSID